MPLTTSPTGHTSYQFPFPAGWGGTVFLTGPRSDGVGRTAPVSTHRPDQTATTVIGTGSSQGTSTPITKLFCQTARQAMSREQGPRVREVPHISKVRPVVHDKIVDAIKDALSGSTMVGVQYDFWNRENTEVLIDRVKRELAPDYEIIFADEGIRDEKSCERFLETVTRAYGHLFLENKKYRRYLEYGVGAEVLIRSAMGIILDGDDFSEDNPLTIIFDGYDLDRFSSKLLNELKMWINGAVQNFRLIVFYRDGKIEQLTDHRGWAIQELQIGFRQTMQDEEVDRILGDKRSHIKTKGVLLTDYHWRLLEEQRFTEKPLPAEQSDFYHGQYHPLYQVAYASEMGRTLGQNSGLSIQPGEDIAVVDGGAFEICTFLIFRNTANGALALFHVWPGVTGVQDIERVLQRVYENDSHVIFDALRDDDHGSERYKLYVRQDFFDKEKLSKQPPLQVIAAIGQRSHADEALYFLKDLKARGYPLDVDQVQVVGMDKGRMHLRILYDRQNDQIVFQKNGEQQIYRFPGFNARYDLQG
ncbi:MAG: hypothetical protein HQM16_04665 [Deltaproteobacteria bacterium]|nr:hypothetical protein [Deltaproteobacteria bacterium]